jgi:Tol biopolymer transport system component
MAPHPADRYASAEEMRQDLRTLATGSLRTAASSPSSTPATGLAVTSVQARTVGPYRILERLGGGGMGIVYRAEDTRLGRLVALKFLPPELTRDPVAKARFQQEARAASALDHTNICTIYEVGETADEQLYLAMPCYDGETLRRRMERGPLPIEEAADIACQVARGLAKAHRQGIVHRDIKPANLILTTDGVVKILDFGIAKLAGEVGLTRTGSVVGTPAYMSPEQMRGEEVDARTDLWSLGVVLYEMLAGRRPFPGEHESVVRQAILGQQPEPISRVRPEVPAELARLVDGLLAKQPAARTGSAEEAAAELRVISGQTSGVLTAAGAVAARRGGSRWAVAALAVAAVVSLGLGLFLAVRARSGGAPVAATFTRLTDQEGRESFPSLSPDGGLLVYAASAGGATHIFLQRVGGDNPIDLTAGSPADDTQPAFSPDGARIAFRSERDGGGIFLMGATGGPVRRLTDFGFNPAWSPDGREILCASEGISDPVLRHTVSGLWRVDVATGVRRPVATGDAVQPSWSPHGRRIAYWGRSHEGAQRIVWTARPDGSGAVAAVRDGFLNWNPVWSPDGARLYFASDRGGSMNLWRVEIDEESGAVRGAPEPIVTPSPWSGLISLSREGHRLAFAINESKANIERAGFDPVRGAAGALTPVTQGSRAVRSAAPSPDGKWIAFHTSAPQEDLFVVRADGGGLRRLTDDAARDRFPRWSPDGSRLLFYSDRSGKYEAWSIRPDGGGLEQLTQVRGEPVFDPFWAPDGGRLGASLGFSGPVVIDLAGGIGRRQPLRVPMPSPETFSANDWSSDGDQLVAFDRNDELETYSFRTQTVRKLGAQGRTPFWLPDGRHVVFLREGVVRLLDTRTGEERPVLTPPPASRFIYVRPAADGRGLILVRAAEEGDIGMVTLP